MQGQNPIHDTFNYLHFSAIAIKVIYIQLNVLLLYKLCCVTVSATSLTMGGLYCKDNVIA